MPTIRAKLKQLKDADVRWISLVDRAATRIPFRVVKRDKENSMGIDLTKVFKREDSGTKPYVSALVVFAQKNEKASAQVLEAIKQHGFTTDRVQKSDEGETLVYAQGDQSADAVVVRLSDQTLVTVGGLKTPTGWVGELVEKQGFFPDLQMAGDILQQQITEIVAKSETPQEDLEAGLTSYAEYLSQMAILPSACYKLDESIVEIVKKCACTEEEKPGEKPAEGAKKEEKETEEEKKKRVAKHPPSEMAPPDEEDDQKPPPNEAYKTEIATVLTALKGIEERTSAQLTGLGEKLTTVVDEQVVQKKVLDDVVKKADTLEKALGTTVTAPPISEDRPSFSTRMRVQKDDDPRTGTFDTAYLRRRK